MSERTDTPAGDVPRHTRGDRVKHWTIALCFFFLAASGLALFHPAFWPLTGLLGGGVWSRILHPYLGVVMAIAFAGLAARHWKDNLIQDYDREWAKRMPDIINNRGHDLPEIDKYNVGQKRLFQVLVVSMTLLLLSGIVLWRDWVAAPVELVRIGAVVHALAAFVLMLGIIAHAYSAIFWVRGALRGMTRGTVTHGWARHHHPLWYRRVMGGGK